jgi:hypothetical protein
MHVRFSRCQERHAVSMKRAATLIDLLAHWFAENQFALSGTKPLSVFPSSGII